MKLLLLALIFSHSALAQVCLDDDNRSIPIENDQVLEWKKTTRNLFKDRTHVIGYVVKIYPDRNDHNHFSIQIGDGKSDTLEVVYNKDFGKLPALRLGDEVEACGDYITSTKAGKYPVSPDRAIIHWVHSANKDFHQDGFLIINGVLYGNKHH